MQETSGTTLVDLSGNGHNGTYDNPFTSVPGPFTGWTAAHFASTGGALVTGVPASNGPMAMEFWAIFSNDTYDQYLFNYTNASFSGGMGCMCRQISTCGGNTAITIHGLSGFRCATHPCIYNTAWCHGVIQRESDGYWHQYITPLDTTITVTDAIDNRAMSVPGSGTLLSWAMAVNHSGVFNGNLAAVAYYDHALSAATIRQHFDAARGVSPGICAYGTRAKAASPAQVVLNEALLIAILEGFSLTWWEVLLLVLAGQQVNITALCSSLPPSPPPPTPDALNYPPYKLLPWLYQNIWNYYCECIPGSSTTIPPPNGTTTKPAGMPDPRIIVINPTNPCLDLTEVRRMLDTVIRQTNIDVQLDTLMQRYSLPFATVLGAAHSGLTATGSFAISRLIGVQIVITDRGPNRELEGAPNYVWDLGWISCMDGNGFIQERRITRDVEVWMPREFQEATTLGYVFKDGVTARIVELEAEV